MLLFHQAYTSSIPWAFGCLHLTGGATVKRLATKTTVRLQADQVLRWTKSKWESNPQRNSSTSPSCWVSLPPPNKWQVYWGKLMMCVAIMTKMCRVWAHLRQWPLYTPSRIRAGDRQSEKKRSALNLQPPGWRSVSCAFWGNPSTMMRFCVTKIRSRTFSPRFVVAHFPRENQKKPQPTWLPSTVFSQKP